MAYTTDLTNKEFAVIEPFLPRTSIQTRPPKWSKHQIINGILYQLVNGCKWIDLPKDLPPSGTVFHYFNKWKKDGVWDELTKIVFVQSRLDLGKKRNANTFTVRLTSGRQYRHRKE
jgi:transposase